MHDSIFLNIRKKSVCSNLETYVKRTQQLMKGRKRDFRGLLGAERCSKLRQKGRVRDFMLVRPYCRLSGERILPWYLLAECPDPLEVLYTLYNNQEEWGLLPRRAFTLV